MTIPAYSLVDGVGVGLQYGLLAMGLVLIYRTSRVLNFAHGQLGVVAAVLLSHLVIDGNVPYAVALPIVLVVAALTGAGSELVIRRLADRPRLLVMVATIGLSQVLYLISLLPFIRPSGLLVEYPLPFHVTFTVGPFVNSAGRTLTIIAAPIIALGFAGFFALSKTGMRLRATADNPESARLAGIPVKRMGTIAWVLAALLSACTAILAAPDQGSAFTNPLGPDLLLRALTAALLAGMTSMTVAFIAGIAIGVIQQVLQVNYPSSPATIELWMFALIIVALVLRVSRLRATLGATDRATWRAAEAPPIGALDPFRRRLGQASVVTVFAAAIALTWMVNEANAYQLGRVVVFAMIAVSLTILAGWAGQISLGHFAVVAVGAVVFARLSDSMPLPLTFLVAGVIGAVVSAVIGIPALRIPGLFLAVTTLGLTLVTQSAVLPTPCEHLPWIGSKLCTGLPDPNSTLVSRPDLFGIDLTSNRRVYLVVLVVLMLMLIAAVAWRDHGLARVLLAVRGNEVAAAAMGVRPIRVKLTAFAVSGFLAGVAGVCFGLVQPRYGATDFPPSVSIALVAMVVVGGLGSISGAVWGAIYFIGSQAIFGSTPTVQFLTSSIGLLFFLLVMPSGVGPLVSSGADAVSAFLRRAPKAQVEATPVGAGGTA
jgi:ABC-type branched-subunit amino acid transport system permease subunit